jgi:hypothetical protein
MITKLILIDPTFICTSCNSDHDSMWLLDHKAPPERGHHWTHPVIRFLAATDEEDGLLEAQRASTAHYPLVTSERTAEDKHEKLEARIERIEGMLEDMQGMLFQLLHSRSI